MSSLADDRGDDRLERLERETARLAGLLERSRTEVRNLQWLVAGVAILGSGALFYFYEAGFLKVKGVNAGVEKTLEAQEFGLYNRQGDRVMLTDYDKFGYPNLVFMDLKKNYRMGVKVWPEGGGTPGMVFYDDTGIRGNWRMDENGGTVLNLMGRGKKGKIALGVTSEGDPTFTVTDRDGKELFAVPRGASAANTAGDQPKDRQGPGTQNRPPR